LIALLKELFFRPSDIAKRLRIVYVQHA
jgi:hypothetical protein